MGIFNFFKNKIQVARENQPVRKEHIIYENKKEPIERKTITDETFKSKQFQYEMLAFVSMKYKENNSDYSETYKSLMEMDVELTRQQANELIETFKLWNNVKSKKDRFSDLVKKAQSLINENQKSKAFELVYEAYIEDHSDIELVQLIAQIADTFNTREFVLGIFDKLILINPKDSYNIRYRKALYLKTKECYSEALDIFRQLNTELKFAWNYYQIAIIQNLLGNTDNCLSNLKTTFDLDPNLKRDAKNFSELQNLQQDERFILLTT